MHGERTHALQRQAETQTEAMAEPMGAVKGDLRQDTNCNGDDVRELIAASLSTSPLRPDAPGCERPPPPPRAARGNMASEPSNWNNACRHM